MAARDHTVQQDLPIHMVQPIVFVTHAAESRQLYYGQAALDALGALAELRLNPLDRPLTTPELAEHAGGAAVIVADRATPGEAALFAALPGLAAFVRCAVDISTIDVAAASAAGVLVTRASPGFAAAVAELVLGFMIDLGRGISRAGIAYRAGRAPPVAMGTQIAGCTVGIIGFGVIGRRLACVLRALDAEVLACDPHARIDPTLAVAVAMPDLLARSDFVVCLALASPATENLIDAAAFTRMRRGAYFINGARGGLVDEAALAAALDAGHLAGAAMDVGRAADQMPSPALAARPDVVATPHVGGLTPQAAQHQAMETTRQVADILSGRVPQGAVNADAIQPRAHPR